MPVGVRILDSFSLIFSIVAFILLAGIASVGVVQNV